MQKTCLPAHNFYLIYMSDPSSTRGRYELTIENRVVYADYHRQGGVLFIDYVFAPPELRGTGAAGRLMETIVQSARNEKVKITPICGYAASWLKRHPKHSDLLA